MTFNELFVYVITTKPGIFVFKMVPAKKIVDSYGAVYRVNNTGMLEEVWKTHGWYSYSTFLSSSGEILVRIDEGRRDDFKLNDPVITINKKGREIYQYILTELGLTYDDVKIEERGIVMY